MEGGKRAICRARQQKSANVSAVCCEVTMDPNWKRVPQPQVMPPGRTLALLLGVGRAPIQQQRFAAAAVTVVETDMAVAIRRQQKGGRAGAGARRRRS